MLYRIHSPLAIFKNRLSNSISSTRNYTQTSSLLTTNIVFNYHMSYLMDSKHDDRFVKIDRRAFHLYRDSLLNFPQQPFNQKIFLTILIDTVRTKQSYNDFERLAEYGLQHIDQFKQPLSIFSFATQLYLYNYPKKQQSFILAKKGFQFFKTNPNMKFSSYYVMKFLIFIEKNVGLDKFTDNDYKLINFTRFKPLFLCFTLQMFYQNNLQHYQTIQYLFQLFTSSESIIPFADIHHYKLATKRITDPRFKEFVDNLSKRLIEQRSDDTSQKSSYINVNGDDNGIAKEQRNTNGLQIDNHFDNDSSSINKSKVSRQQKTSFPWQQAYTNHVYRQFTYYPSIHYANQQKTHKKKL